MRAALPKIDNVGASAPCVKGTCQVCDHIITTNTFTTKACGEVSKIQSRPLNCSSIIIEVSSTISFFKNTQKTLKN